MIKIYTINTMTVILSTWEKKSKKTIKFQVAKELFKENHIL